MELGIFEKFWDGQPNHLPLLNLQELEVEPEEFNLSMSISKLEAILSMSSEQSIKDGIKLLLESDNWRPHLVASFSFLAIQSSKRDSLLELFWNRLSLGSWVSPQILVTLSICDKEFM